MKKVLFAALASGAILLLSCDLGGKEDYYPLTVGSKWEYSGYVLLETGTDAQPDTIIRMTAAFIANKNDKLSSGEDVTEMIATLESHYYYPNETTITQIDTSYTRETGNAILEYGSKDDTSPDTALVLPLEKDKTWHVNPGVIARVLIQEDVMVKAGTYKNAWKIEQTETGTGYKTYYWYANNIGLVKIYNQHTEQSNTYTFNMELVSANIK
ncbi:MAG: hypothetical protein ACUVUR_05715 [bacterium]